MIKLLDWQAGGAPRKPTGSSEMKQVQKTSDWALS